MVELRAVQPSFPYYGTLTLQEGPYRHDLLAGRGVLVRPELLAQLDLRVGDRLLIGTQEFEIRGVISSEPGRNLGTFSLGPRVLIDYADLESTGLLGFGSRSTRQMLIKAPASTARVVEDRLTEALRNKFVRARGYWQNEDRIGENLSRAENYLSLVGLVILILGGIGVSSVTRVFVQQKVRSIAILKCLGGSSRTVLAVYLAQVVLLGLAGSLLGVALAWVVVSSVPLVPGVASLLEVDYGLSASAVWQGLAVGLLVSLLFAVVPLLDVRQVKPSLLLRHEASGCPRCGLGEVGGGRCRGRRAGGGGRLAGGVVARGPAAVGRPRRDRRDSPRLRGGARLGHPAAAVRALVRAPAGGAAHGASRATRPASSCWPSVSAAFFILGVRSLQVNLLRGFAVQAGPEAPDMFLVDIQGDQRRPSWLSWTRPTAIVPRPGRFPCCARGSWP